MKRTLLGTAVLALTAGALVGCASESPVGPGEDAGRPSLANVGPADRNQNGVVCGRRVSNVAPGSVGDDDAGSYAMPGYVLVDDRGGTCPAGFARMVPV